jgi:tetratricopeptide (TPR) repeat protein/predicted Ser/Thr protein kinase
MRKLLQYQIVEKIGAGGMGEVWRAMDTRLQREVALKLLLPERAGDPGRRERFLREARSASSLNHPNIVTIYEIDSDQGVDFIAMELVRGRTLQELLRVGKLPPAIAVAYGIEICGALVKAHASGIVHRDLKPGNIMITTDGHVKVVDFGLAKHNRPETEPDSADGTQTSPLTEIGMTIGTLAYMSPEQALGDAVDGRSDIFSLGVVLYQALSGVRPFEGATRPEIMRCLLRDDPALVRTLAPSVPEPLSGIVQKCLAKRREDRYSSAGELLADLSRPESGFGGLLARSDEETKTEELQRPSLAIPGTIQQRFWIAAALSLVLIATILILAPGWRGWGKRSSERAMSVTADGKYPTAAPVPTTAYESYQQGRAFLQRFDRPGNAGRAIGAFENSIKLDPAYALGYAGLAEAYVRKDVENSDPQWKRLAMDSARKAVQLNGDIALCHLALGIALLSSDQRDEAARELQRANQIDPRNSRVYLWIGNEQAARGNNAGAETAYQKAVQFTPDDWVAHSTLGTFFYRLARYEDAAHSWEGAVQLTPDNVVALRNLAAAYHMLGRDEDAAAKLQRALEIQPAATTYNNLGTLRFFQGQYGDAAEAFDKAVQLSANNYLYWGNLGDAYRWTPGGKDKAKPAYLRASQLLNEKIAASPADPDLHANLAVYLIKSGDRDRALLEIGIVEKSQRITAFSWFKALIVHELCGQRDQALAALQAALRAKYSLQEIRNEPELVSLRTDPRYHRMVGSARP